MQRESLKKESQASKTWTIFYAPKNYLRKSKKRVNEVKCFFLKQISMVMYLDKIDAIQSLFGLNDLSQMFRVCIKLIWFWLVCPFWVCRPNHHRFAFEFNFSPIYRSTLCKYTMMMMMMSRFMKISQTLTTAILMIRSGKKKKFSANVIAIHLHRIVICPLIIIINLCGKCTHSFQVHCIILDLTPFNLVAMQHFVWYFSFHAKRIHHFM